MEDFGDYIRLDSWAEVTELGLGEGFKGYLYDCDDLRSANSPEYKELVYSSKCEAYPFCESGRSCTWAYAYILKSQLPQQKSNDDEDFVPMIAMSMEEIQVVRVCRFIPCRGESTFNIDIIYKSGARLTESFTDKKLATDRFHEISAEIENVNIREGYMDMVTKDDNGDSQ